MEIDGVGRENNPLLKPLVTGLTIISSSIIENSRNIELRVHDSNLTIIDTIFSNVTLNTQSLIWVYGSFNHAAITLHNITFK